MDKLPWIDCLSTFIHHKKPLKICFVGLKSRFKRLSRGKIWFDDFSPCKRFDILQLWQLRRAIKIEEEANKTIHCVQIIYMQYNYLKWFHPQCLHLPPKKICRGKGDTDGSIDHTHLLLHLRPAPTSSHCFLPTPPPPISSNLLSLFLDSICAWIHLDYEGVSSLPKSIQVNICRTLMTEFAPSLISAWSPLPFRKKIFFRYICVTFCV